MAGKLTYMYMILKDTTETLLDEYKSLCPGCDGEVIDKTEMELAELTSMEPSVMIDTSKPKKKKRKRKSRKAQGTENEQTLEELFNSILFREE